MRFDKQDWVLLPDVHVLVQIHSAAQDHLRTAGARKAADEGVPLLKVRFIRVVRQSSILIFVCTKGQRIGLQHSPICICTLWPIKRIRQAFSPQVQERQGVRGAGQARIHIVHPGRI